MGERKGTNKYYPPDFDPKKHRSLDAYHGTHALRERARKLHEGILIIRFEMPYNIWCEGCNNPIGMGVRYNAEKSKIGMYYSTPIYKFRMKCHLCDNHFEIKTDPANHDYVIIEGARRKEQRWDPKENEQIVPEDKNDQKKLATDAMFKIEHGVADKNKSKVVMPAISQLKAVREQWKDDYDLNKLARGKFRDSKKLLKTETDKDQALLEKSSLEIDLVPENPADIKMAALLQYKSSMSFEEKQKEKREEINKRSIFAQPSTSGSPASTPSSGSGGSDISEGVLSKIKFKHKEAHHILSKIVTKHKSQINSEIKAKIAKTSEMNPSKHLGILQKSKITDSIQNCKSSSGCNQSLEKERSDKTSRQFPDIRPINNITTSNALVSEQSEETEDTDKGTDTEKNMNDTVNSTALNSLKSVYMDSSGDSD